MKNHDEANVLHCGKTKLCRTLHSFGMFTPITYGAAVLYEILAAQLLPEKVSCSDLA